MTDEPIGLDEFVDSYLETALWATMDQSDERTGGEPLDANYSAEDFAPEALESIRRDCARFMAENQADIESGCDFGPNCDSPESRAGHDFFLTRNGHGAGFWDGDWDDGDDTSRADRLTEASKAFGESEPYVGDDGRLYV